jgi:hypothetical protein
MFDLGPAGFPVIFPDTITHDTMRINMNFQLDSVLSAGYIKLHDGTFVCYGTSLSLDVSPRSIDNQIIRDYFSIIPKADSF